MSSITIIEPNTHSKGHYLPFLIRMVNILAKEYNVINIVTSSPINEIILDNKNIVLNYYYTNAINDLSYKIISFITKLLKINGLSRILKYDYLHFKSMQTANKLEPKKILFLYTGYYLPHIVHKYFYTNLNIIYYRISHPYSTGSYKNIFKLLISKASRRIRRSIFRNPLSKITFQTECLKNNFIEDIGLNPYLLRLPISKELSILNKESLHSKIVYLLFGINHVGKDWNVVVDAFNKLSKNNMRQVKVIFAGNFKKSKDCISPEELKFNKEIEVEIINRYISEEEKDDLYIQTNYSILSFKSSFNMSSGTLIDSLTYCKPVICSSNTEFEYIVNKYNSGYLFKNSDYTSLFKILEKSIIDKEKKRSELKYKQFLDDFSFNNTLITLENIWSNNDNYIDN